MHHTRVNPLIYIRNEAKNAVPPAELERLVAAVQRQVNEHFQPVWGVGAQLVVVDKKDDVPVHAYQIIVYETAKVNNEANFLGYHFSPKGYPVASIFADAGMVKNNTISDTLSHEVLEMLIDPACNLYAYRPADVDRPERIYFYEVCDAVQCHKYDIDGVQVCNFVYPEWFENNWKDGGKRKFDHLGLLDHPFHVLPECYADVFEAKRGSFTVWGKNSVVKKEKPRRPRRDARKEKMNFADVVGDAAPRH